ncbi:hypothetical protein [Chelativorans alearense]|uniref:hypothetical protein n=1 Tax=Chelativorans alearense TaxID=2681495 RepID=UPI0013D8A1F9|nr:hypothetical protein [Chelativorans alearense]
MAEDSKAKKVWRCDGCGDERTLRKIDEHRIVAIVITSGPGETRFSRKCQLCPHCQLRLVRQADPMSWSGIDTDAGTGLADSLVDVRPSRGAG